MPHLSFELRKLSSTDTLSSTSCVSMFWDLKVSNKPRVIAVREGQHSAQSMRVQGESMSLYSGTEMLRSSSTDMLFKQCCSAFYNSGCICTFTMECKGLT